MEYPRNRGLGPTYLGGWYVPVDGHEIVKVGGDPWLVAKGDRVKRYDPLRRAALVEEFRKLASDFSPDAVVAFADQRGALTSGQSTIAHAMKDLAGTDAEIPFVGEPLGVWARELPRFAEVVDVWRAVSILRRPSAAIWQDVKDARRLIRERFHIQDGSLRYTGPMLRRRFLDPDDPSYERVMRELHTDKDMVGAARYFVHSLVNESLSREVSPAVMPFLRSTIRFLPQSLLGAIYLLLAGELAGRRLRAHQCELCGKPFFPKRRDAHFCEDACRYRANYLRRQRGDAGEPS